MQIDPGLRVDVWKAYMLNRLSGTSRRQFFFIDYEFLKSAASLTPPGSLILTPTITIGMTCLSDSSTEWSGAMSTSLLSWSVIDTLPRR